MPPSCETEITSDLDHLPTDAGLLATVGARHLAPIVYAVRAYSCRLAIIRQRSRRFKFVGSDPIIGIVGDDTDRALGPSGFHRKSVERFVSTCRYAAVVSCGAMAEPYVLAASTAMLTRKNSVVIETLPAHETAWVEMVRRAQPDAQLVICRPRAH